MLNFTPRHRIILNHFKKQDVRLFATSGPMVFNLQPMQRVKKISFYIKILNEKI